MSKIPIIILTMDRPIQFKDMIVSIENYTDMNLCRIIICDNNSTHPDMVSFLKELESKYTVIYNKENLVFKGLNPGLALVDTDYFIISDPDIKLNTQIPKDWPTIFQNILIEKYDTPKVGMSLNINFLMDTELTRVIRGCESFAWRELIHINTINDPCYYASIDTTMSMYRRNTFLYWDKQLIFDEKHGIVPGGFISQDHYNKKLFNRAPIRVAGRFMAEHLGWYMDKKYLPDLDYYKERSKKQITSTITGMYSRIIGHHNDGK